MRRTRGAAPASEGEKKLNSFPIGIESQRERPLASVAVWLQEE